MKVTYFDCFNGAGGDMIVASLIDAGANVDDLRKGLDSLGLDDYSISIEKISKQGFAATRFHVELDQRLEQPRRHLGDILKIIQSSALSEWVKQNSSDVFRRLADAEAKVHGCAVEQIHFHEVGAVDAIVDVVGAVLALELLGTERIICSPIPTGSGTVTCEHGTLPVPAPATAELLKGVPLAASDEVGELTTPTAAAVLTTLATHYGTMPGMTLTALGYGAGSREGSKAPNLLRVLIGETAEYCDADEITVLETNLDDSSPEEIGHCLERLLAEGALDAYAVPIQMKKSRPGVLLAVLCEQSDVTAMERVLFAETTTFGVRRHNVRRTKLPRRHAKVSTPFGEISVKIGECEGTLTASPEYEDCLAAAERTGVALRKVIAAAKNAWYARKEE